MSSTDIDEQKITFASAGDSRLDLARDALRMMSSPSLPTVGGLWAGAATVDLTPSRPMFLFGYPHVTRTSTGVHDRLEGAVLYLRNSEQAALFLAHDLIFVPGDWAQRVRARITALTGVPASAILLSATHTHSGPVTVDQLGNAADAVVPRVDASYLEWLAERVVAAAKRAIDGAEPAELGLAVARADGVGTNRHDPAGPADPDVPVLVTRSRATRTPIGCMLVYAMHPTVLHEDSTLISADFPHFARAYLKTHVFRHDCPVVYHNGASGDQSPRHVTRGNTFAEAQRLGERLGRQLGDAIARMEYSADAALTARCGAVDLMPRVFPPLAEAERLLAERGSRYRALQQAGQPAPLVRTAECDVFGAEETAELARAAANGSLAQAIAARTPAEIQVIRIGPWAFIGWPGEFFVEYALAVRAKAPHAFVITLANGELQGYIVTPAAAAAGRYEALNAIFAPENGRRFVDTTLALLGLAP